MKASMAAFPGPAATSRKSGTRLPASIKRKASWSEPTSGRRPRRSFRHKDAGNVLRMLSRTVERLHPQYRRWLDRRVSVAWSKVPLSGGAWAEWEQCGPRHALPAAPRWRRAISVRRRAHVVDKRLARGRGPVGASHASTDQPTPCNVITAPFRWAPPPPGRAPVPCAYADFLGVARPRVADDLACVVGRGAWHPAVSEHFPS